MLAFSENRYSILFLPEDPASGRYPEPLSGWGHSPAPGAAPSVPPRSGLLRDGNCEVLTGWLALSTWLAFSTARLMRPFLRPFHTAAVDFSRLALDPPHCFGMRFSQRNPLPP